MAPTRLLDPLRGDEGIQALLTRKRLDWIGKLWIDFLLFHDLGIRLCETVYQIGGHRSRSGAQPVEDRINDAPQRIGLSLSRRTSAVRGDSLRLSASLR